MKNLLRKLTMLTAVATLGFLFSCNKDEETFDAPVISVESSQLDETNTFEGEPGAALSYTINITAEAGFVTLYANDAVADEKDPGTTPTTWSYPSSDQLPDDEGTYTIEYYAIDEEGQESNHITITIIVTSSEARSYSAVLLTPPLGETTEEKTSETFFSTNTGLTYSMNEVLTTQDPISADIDFGYFYGENDGATLSDPASYPFAYGQANWGTRNSTTFRRTSLTSADLTEVTSWADIDAEFEGATAADGDAGIESQLAIGEVLAFETDSDKAGGAKRGLILVVSYSGEGTSIGKIELDILVQEEASAQ